MEHTDLLFGIQLKDVMQVSRFKLEHFGCLESNCGVCLFIHHDV